MIRTTLLIISTMLATGPVWAQSMEDIQSLSPEERKAYWQSMSPEEREQKRSELRAEFDALSAEIDALRASATYQSELSPPVRDEAAKLSATPGSTVR